MKTEALKRLIEMFGGVPLAFYSATGKDGQAHETWTTAKAEIEALEESHAEMKRVLMAIKDEQSARLDGKTWDMLYAALQKAEAIP